MYKRQVPVGPVQTVDEVFQSDQVAAREMAISVPNEKVEDGAVKLIGNPLKLSKTPVTYRKAPPTFGEDTEAVLRSILPKKR